MDSDEDEDDDEEDSDEDEDEYGFFQSPWTHKNTTFVCLKF